MVKYLQERKTSLFLIELIMALLFFALAAALCMQFFVQANQISRQSVNLNQALFISQSLAEEFRATNGQMPDQTLYFDQDWNESKPEDAVFISTFSVTSAINNMLLGNIAVFEYYGESIYTLEVQIWP